MKKITLLIVSLLFITSLASAQMGYFATDSVKAGDTINTYNLNSKYMYAYLEALGNANGDTLSVLHSYDGVNWSEIHVYWGSETYSNVVTGNTNYVYLLSLPYARWVMVRLDNTVYSATRRKDYNLIGINIK